MRTDVKVGLICVFAVILGAVIYFVVQGNKNPQQAQASSQIVRAPGSGGSVSPVASLPVAATAPALDAAPASGGIAGSFGPLAQSGGIPSGGPGSAVGGPMIAPPSPAPATMPASSAVSGTTNSSGLSGGPSISPGISGSSIVPAASTTQPSRNSLSSNNFGSANTFGSSSDRGTIESFDRTPRSSSTSGLGGGTYSGTSSGFGSSGTSGTSSSLHSSGNTYTIQKGDMLAPIAKKFNVSVKAIEGANPGIDSTRLKINQVINIPAADKAVSASTSGSAGASSTAGHATATTRPSHTTAGSAAQTTIHPGSSYTVKKGDTLAKIATAAYGDKNAWKRIFRANRGELADADTVPVGTVLRLPN